ncbi:unnamed protein product, partial [Ectocarpus sp. 6 AP-2014]
CPWQGEAGSSRGAAGGVDGGAGERPGRAAAATAAAAAAAAAAASESRGLGSGSGGVGVARDSRAVGTAGLCPGLPFPHGGNERCRHRQRRGVHRARRISVRGHEG